MVEKGDVVFVVEHRMNIPYTSGYLDTVTMFVASTKEKAIAWMRNQSDENEGWYALYNEVIDTDLTERLRSAHPTGSSKSLLEFYDLAGNKLDQQPIA